MRRVTRRPGNAPPTESELIEREIQQEELRYNHEQRVIAQRWANRMVLAWALGKGTFLLLAFIVAVSPVAAIFVAAASTVVNAVAAYGIGKAALVAPDRFPVRYFGRLGGPRGKVASGCVAISSFALMVTAALYVLAS
ncbi:hypothetical protein GCM10022255_037720 [Dactylosporangium darangshiense]|uniref:DUF4395 domain-containing protein n=2 Tax=Dactylosporangium darangshiense TaxID=579108 RepID=A0ABP8D921_9ACTN